MTFMVLVAALAAGVILFYLIPAQWRIVRNQANTTTQRALVAITLVLSSAVAACCLGWLLLLGYCAVYPVRL